MKKSSNVLLAILIALTSYSSVGLTAGPQKGLPQAANDDEIPAPFTIPEDKKMSEKQVFARYIDVKTTRYVFRRAQETMIQMPEDRAFGDLFYSWGDQIPLLGQLFEDMRGAHARSLDDFSAHAQTSMIKLQPVTELFKRFDAAVTSSAQELGFTSTAIANREVYFQAREMNAFTVSGNSERLIAVLGTYLTEEMDPRELSVVLSHEMGHVLGKHSFKGLIHNLMMNVIARTFIAPGLMPNMVAQTQGLDLINFSATQCPIGHSGCSHRHESQISQMGASGFQPMQSIDGPSFNQVLNRGLNLLMNLPPQMKAAMIKMYMANLIMVMKAETADPQAIEAAFELFNYNPNSPSIMVPHPMMIQRVLVEADSAISRSQEKTADAYAASLYDKQYAAGVMVKLAGYPKDPNSKNPRADKRAIIQSVFKQVKDYLEKSKGRSQAGFVGSSHPAVALRLDGVLKDGTYPEVLFRQPFYRLLVIEDMLQTKAKSGDKSAAEVLPVLRRDILNVLSKNNLSSAPKGPKSMNSNFEKLIQYYAFNRVKLLETREALMKQTPKSREMMQAIGAIEAEIQGNFTLLVETEKILVAQIAKATGVDKEFGESRLAVLQALMKSGDIEQLKAIHRGVQPTGKMGDRVAARQIPVDGDRVSNPFVAQSCEAMLGHAAEVRAQVAKRTAALTAAIAASKPNVNVTVTFGPAPKAPTK